MTPELRELLQRFQGGDGVEPLTDDELTQLREGLAAYAAELADGDVTAETVQQLQDLAETCDAVDSQRTERGERAAQLQADAAEAIGRIRAHDAEQDGQDEADGQPADGDDSSDGGSEETLSAEQHTDDTPAPDAPPEESGEGRQQAAIRRASQMAARRPQSHAPRRRSNDGGPDRARAVLTSNVRHGQLSPGDAFTSFEQLGEVMAGRLQAMGPRGGSQPIATQMTTYPAGRFLSGRDSAAANTEKMAATSTLQALTASGGICTPVAVDYSIPTFSVADRPIRTALPGYGATRGGIRYLTPPRMSATTGAVGLWTHQNDANPTSPTTKPVLRIACPSEVQVLVDAVTLRLEFGNLAGRFSPEVITANTELALAYFARFAELNLLNQILAGSTEVTHTGAALGATPELLATLDQALAGMRYTDRLSSMTKVRVMFPEWVRPLIRSDMARRLATDSSEANGGALNVSDAQIDAWFSNRNVNVTWTPDGIAAQGSGNTYPFQGFAAQSTGALLDYPAKLVFPMFPEGTWQFLDGGQLDLGVVRDSTLDATNDYETFFETFEGVANRGIVSYKVIVPLQPTGATAGTQDTSAYVGA